MKEGRARKSMRVLSKTFFILSAFFPRLLIAGASVLLAGVFSCDLGGFTSLPSLHPPLGLQLFSETPGYIIIRFEAYNDEEAFGGYNVYMNTDEATLRLRRTNDLLLPFPRTEPPSYPAQSSSDVWKREYTITHGPGTAREDLDPLDTWYITVSSFDSLSYSLNSDKPVNNSELAEVYSIKPDGGTPIPNPP